MALADNSTATLAPLTVAEVPPSDVSASQAGCAIAFAICVVLLTCSYITDAQGAHSRCAPSGPGGDKEKDGQTWLLPAGAIPSGLASKGILTNPAARKSLLLPVHATPADMEAVAGAAPGPTLWQANFLQCLLLNGAALRASRATLTALVELGLILLWFFVADRTSLLRMGDKAYSRDVFLFVYLILLCVGFGTSLRQMKVPALLGQQQTGEWKGWMQVLFLLYHYYDAREAYNAIRVFIAAYVWMTGYGNFHYYYRTRNFSFSRFLGMMWRLNFLVAMCCAVMRNSYMLYYICPMHTLFTLMVYAILAIFPKANNTRSGIVAKLLFALTVVLVVWDVKPVFYTLWRPFTWLVGFADARRPSNDLLHEWFFRSGLDRFIWIHGMLVAYLHPQLDAWLKRLDELPRLAQAAIRAVLFATTTAALVVWYQQVYCLPKLEYNRLHPVTSWVPITCWMLLRNLTPQLRSWHLSLFSWLGCITLETYISQFHVWLRSNLPDGQPKFLLNLLPGYPLLNFGLCSALYVLVSFRLFNLTAVLKTAAIPHEAGPRLWHNLLLLTASCSLLWLAGRATRDTLPQLIPWHHLEPMDPILAAVGGSQTSTPPGI